MKQANPAPNKIRKQSSSGAQSPASRASFANTRSLYFLSSIIVFALLTFLAHRQSPRPDPFQPVQALSWDWWKYPIERNAFKRLPVITSDLNDVFALPNSEKVWAVGDEGMIVHSEDGGETWVRQEVNWETVVDSALTQDLTEQEQLETIPKLSLEASQEAKALQNPAQSEFKEKNFDAQIRRLEDALANVGERAKSLALQAVYFISANQGWAVGSHGTIFITNNGGTTWTPLRSGTTSSLKSVHFINDTTGWVVGENGTILMTSNGGAAWQVQTSGTTSGLTSIHFANTTNGWAVGSAGTILATRDEGATWQAQTCGTTSGLMPIHFANTTGWAVDHGETILATRDGGATWQVQTSGTTTSLQSVHFVTDRIGWAVGWNGTILVTRNGGVTWQAQTSGLTNSLRSVHFVNAMTGWAVSYNGTILATSNGGATWQVRANEPSRKLVSVHFVNAMAGWAVDWSGAILATSDGGTTWRVQMSGGAKHLESVHFVNDTTGWVVGYGGKIFVTTNSGATWQAQASGSTSWLASVHFVNATTGWAVGGDHLDDQGTILHTVNSGRTWQVQMTGAAKPLSSVHFVNAMNGWVVGLNGTILGTQDGGASWQAQISGTPNSLSSVHFVNTMNGWAVGGNGIILTTKNGGLTWQVQASGVTNWLCSIHFVDDMVGWIVSVYGTILKTTGGQTWKDPTLPYSRSFAPCYYLSLLLLTPLLYLAFRKPKPIEAEQKSVADMLVSDRPIAAGDPDPLEFNAIARGLSRFLRNENTQPPLTIAITGEWGSGKSSLMNLLKADLERYGFRPVWFNAWHHQKEEHLLAALLENVRNQAIPRWWRLEGLSFRCHLLWLRAKRRRFVAALLLLLFAFAVGYVAVNPSARLANLKTHVTNLEKDISDVVIALLPTKPAPKDSARAEDSSTNNGTDSSNSFSLLPLLLSAIASLVIVYRGLKAFGVNPVSLMASMSGQFKAGDLKAQMSFRYRFAQEFDEVTRALHPRTMLIFIDDLDRCQPKSVLEVLEAVNFLVSNGECYVVLGLDLQRVERYVEEGFTDVKEEGFARQYLQKLINIEVPVPQPSEVQSRNLIAPKAREPERARSWWVHALRKAPQFLPKLLPAVIVAATLIAGFMLGQSFFPDEKKEPGERTTIASPVRSDSTSTAAAPVDTTRATSRSEAETPERTSGEGKFIPGQQAKPVLTWACVALGLILLLAAWRLSIPSDVIVKDSPEFEEALRIWHPLIMAKHNTPRSVKRFVNRVRYFAMRQSAETEAQSVWQKLAVWAGMKQKEEAKKVEAVPESILVALSAIHHYDSKLFAMADQIKFNEEGFFEAKDRLQEISHVSFILEAIKEHKAVFENWPPTEEDRKRLEKLSAGIRIN